MLTKKEFTDAMNAVVAQIAEDKRMSQALSSIVHADYGKCYIYTKYALPGLIKLLESIMQDKCEWIEYWLYELECGAKYRPSSITQDGKPIKLKTMADLYTLLKKEYKDKK